MSATKPRPRNTRKIAAVSAGALVLALGSTFTLASWTDSEWVWGGANGAPGIGTSVFSVEQNASAPFDPTGTWAEFDTNAGDELTFTTGSLAMAPGDTVYAPVALRTTANSVAGTVQLQPAVAAIDAAGDDIAVDDAGGELWDAVTVSVYTVGRTAAGTPPECTSDAFVAADWTGLVSGANLGSEAASDSQALAAKAGNVQHYCFALTLPAGAADTLQGRTIAPAWEFLSTSD